MDMNAAIDFCRFVSRTNRNAFQERKKHEWRIVFSVLTFYVSVAALKVTKGVALPNTLWLWVVHLALALATIVFLKFIHTANNTDKNIAHNAEHGIQEMLNTGQADALALFNVDRSLFPWRGLIAPGEGGLWSWFWKAILILIFAIVSAALRAR